MTHRVGCRLLHFRSDILYLRACNQVLSRVSLRLNSITIKPLFFVLNLNVFIYIFGMSAVTFLQRLINSSMISASCTIIFLDARAEWYDDSLGALEHSERRSGLFTWEIKLWMKHVERLKDAFSFVALHVLQIPNF